MALKEVYKRSPHYRASLKNEQQKPFSFFVLSSASAYRAIDLTKNRESLGSIVKASPHRVPPVSCMAEVVGVVDRFYNNKLSGGVAVHEAARWAMSQGIHACGPISDAWSPV